MKENIYFSKKILKLAEENMKMSPETWHKVMNPDCSQCLIERGKALIERLNEKQLQ